MPTEIRAEVDMFLRNAIDDAFAVRDGQLRILEVGIGGDPEGGGNLAKCDPARLECYHTIDKVSRFNPTFVADICSTTRLRDYDIIIMSQTLEHIYNMKAALRGCHTALRHGGKLLVDVPWSYRYHPQEEYDDYWRVSPVALREMLYDAGFVDVKTQGSELLTTGVATK